MVEIEWAKVIVQAIQVLIWLQYKPFSTEQEFFGIEVVFEIRN